MDEVLGTPLDVTDLSGWGVVLLFVVALLTGKLRTNREVQEIRADRDARIAEAGAWKTAWEERGATLHEVLKQNSELLIHTELVATILQSLPTPGATRGPHDG